MKFYSDLFSRDNLTLHMGMSVLCLSHTILVEVKEMRTIMVLVLLCLLFVFIGWFSEYLLENFNSSQLYL